ncbi:uncharacterized protein LOC129315465 [Prosopis cineraria]|uniref:uncharacterized protein LOC129315465 n=1 Tax=Prosopis cineraria TaxID=364024 RepID=UPI00240ECAF0|nr:uncharacterized protein LOC129315465 [Prosopis cineraria]
MIHHDSKKVSMTAESATQDSRKRTLEAFERRLAVGKQHTANITSADSSHFYVVHQAFLWSHLPRKGISLSLARLLCKMTSSSSSFGWRVQ